MEVCNLTIGSLLHSLTVGSTVACTDPGLVLTSLKEPKLATLEHSSITHASVLFMILAVLHSDVTAGNGHFTTILPNVC